MRLERLHEVLNKGRRKECKERFCKTKEDLFKEDVTRLFVTPMTVNFAAGRRLDITARDGGKVRKAGVHLERFQGDGTGLCA